MTYLLRHVDTTLDALLGSLPAIALEGPKACGKTETALRRAEVVISLDDPATFAEVSADPTVVTRHEGVVFIDEWQRVPAIWDVVRSAVDRGPRATFLLAGSAKPPDEAPMHSGAGRIVGFRMRPLSWAERQICAPTVRLADLLVGAPHVEGTCLLGAADYEAEALRSGFPGVRSAPAEARDVLLDAYADRIVQRELAEAQVKVRRPLALQAWLRAYAAATGSTSAYATIATAAAGENPLDAKTSRTYRDALAQLFILEPVDGWWPTNNPLKQLGKAPKHFLCDAGLAASILGTNLAAQAGGQASPHAGALFETLVASSLRAYADVNRARVYHVRTHDRAHEVDFIIERRDGAVIGIEAKRSAHAPTKAGKHLRWLREKLGDRWLGGVVLTCGKRAVTTGDGIHVVPFGLLGP